MLFRSIPKLSIELMVSDEELDKRRKEWKAKEPSITTGYLKRYCALVESGARGAVLKLPGEEK